MVEFIEMAETDPLMIKAFIQFMDEQLQSGNISSLQDIDPLKPGLLKLAKKYPNVKEMLDKHEITLEHLEPKSKDNSTLKDLIKFYESVIVATSVQGVQFNKKCEQRVVDLFVEKGIKVSLETLASETLNEWKGNLFTKEQLHIEPNGDKSEHVLTDVMKQFLTTIKLPITTDSKLSQDGIGFYDKAVALYVKHTS